MSQTGSAAKDGRVMDWRVGRDERTTLWGSMRTILDNRIRVPLDGLSDEQLQELQRAFTYVNPEREKLKRLGKRFNPRLVPEFVNTWETKDGHLTLPRGGADRLFEVLPDIEVEERLFEGDPKLAGQIPEQRLTLRGYQYELRQLAAVHGLALFRSPPGSGKTTAGFGIASLLNLPTLVVVPTLKIFDQWIKSAEKNLGLKPSEIGRIQGKTRIVKPLTIAMQQTLRNCAADYVGTFGVVICDEAQYFAALTFRAVVDLFPAAYRIGLTADERRADGMEFLIHDTFGPVLKEVPRETLIAEGAIVDAKIRVVPTQYDCDWYRRLPPMKKSNVIFQKRLQLDMARDEERNRQIVGLAKRHVQAGMPTLMLALRREHCEILQAAAAQAGMPTGLMLGGVESADESARALAALEAGELDSAVGTFKAVGVGFDVPRLSCGVLAAPCASRDGEQQFNQFVGRFERPSDGKDSAVVFYLWDPEIHGVESVRRIARWRKNVEVLDTMTGEWINAKAFIKNYEKRDNADQLPIGFESPHYGADGARLKGSKSNAGDSENERTEN